ncbi:MAG TPA: VWA domain-containing protein [Gemmataceae bacterium]|nr:VWA domain-containing protein [Gemmataceae bacterium]
MSNLNPDELRRWRLVLGKDSQESLNRMGGCALSSADGELDDALGAIYDETGGEDDGDGQRSAGLGKSSPRLAKWLGDIRNFFKEDVVAVIQNDAIERKGLKQLLFEPEMLKNVQPNIQLVGTLMSLSGKIPERTKETARMVVSAVVEEIKKKLEQKIRQAVLGALNRKEHSPLPNASAIDWKWTIGRNLKNYNTSLKTIIPERIYFFSRAQKSNNWTVIVDMDQSGSMAPSVVYGAVCGSIFASLPALDTHVIAFDTEVVDLTEKCGNDPVNMLFGVQLGGGTDINKSVAYCERFIQEPKQTLFILITDLYEGGNQAQLVRRLADMVESGVRAICLLALSDTGVPTYDENLAKKLVAMGIPCFGCTPQKLPDLLEGALRGADLTALAAKLTAKDKREG